MQAGEFGKTLLINCGFDLTGWTAISLAITAPDGTAVGPRNITSIGAIDKMLDGKTYKALQYVEYVTVSGDFPQDGLYRLKLTVDFGATKRLKTVYKDFAVAA